MKTIITTTLLALALTASAQTSYVQYRIPFDFNNGNFVYSCDTNINISSNVVARIISYKYDSTISYTYPAPTYKPIAIQYEPDNAFGYTPTQALNVPILGPCSLKVHSSIQFTQPQIPIYMLVQYDVVNTTPPPFAAVQSPATTVNAVLQSTVDFTTWTSVATNSSSTTSNSYKFFRVQLQ